MFAAALMLPLVLYDFLTSVGGADAMLGIARATSRSVRNPDLLMNVILQLLPWALALAAVTFNYYTYEIWTSSQSFQIMKVLWWIFLVFDAWSTLLGIINIMLFGNFFALDYVSVIDAPRLLGIERFSLALGLSTIIILAPMAMNRIYHFSKQKEASRAP